MVRDERVNDVLMWLLIPTLYNFYVKFFKGALETHNCTNMLYHTTGLAREENILMDLNYWLVLIHSYGYN